MKSPKYAISLNLLLFGLSACTGNSSINLSSVSSTPTASASPTVAPSGARAIKIIFQQSSGGSFDTPPAGGTPAAPGSGLQATRVFNADGSLLASGGSSSTAWPGWLSSFEIGISGSSNTGSGNSNCARFASSTESTATNCMYGAAGSLVASACGAPTGMFRVSEADCGLGSPLTLSGNGGPNDGVYFRATFNRSTSYLSPTENLMVVMEYSVSGLNPAPANPAQCFSSTTGKILAENCADFVWRAYIKHTAIESVQPFLLLVPPTFASTLSAGVTGAQSTGTGIAAKQFIIPLAGDQNLTVLQISRTQGSYPGTSGTNLLTYCSPGSLPGNSPFCAGMVFYSITFYRI